MKGEIPISGRLDRNGNCRTCPLTRRDGAIQSRSYLKLCRFPIARCVLAQQPGPSRDALLAPDAFVNPEHVHFALKGCLAASLCYLIYNAIAWPGISTAVTTCLLTALTTIGSSHQKQILRICGAIVGGVHAGYGIADFHPARSRFDCRF